MEQFKDYLVDGIQLIALVIGLTQALKMQFNLEGGAVKLLAVIIGAVFMALAEVQGYLPAPYAVGFQVVVKSLAFGLAAQGYYQLYSGKLSVKREEAQPLLDIE